jgi:hypothetical protein
MKQVFVYTSECKILETYNDYVEEIKFPYLTNLSWQAEQFFSKDQLEYERIRMPIHKFNRRLEDGSIETRYAAFDEQLLEFFDCLEDQKLREISAAVDKATKPLHTRIQQLEGMSFWQKIKWSFKR